MRVYISPSSQTENVGVGSYGTEAARMQQLSNIVVAALRNMGHTVYGGDNSLTLSQRIQHPTTQELIAMLHFTPMQEAVPVLKYGTILLPIMVSGWHRTS